MIRLLWLLLALAACSVPNPPTPLPTEEPFYAPDFQLSGLEGAPYRLSDLRGQWVVVNFWATWCAPCVEEMPALQQLADTYADALIVLGVNVRETEAAVRAFAQAKRLHFPLLIAPDDATLIAYSVTGLPQTIVINPEGIIVARTFGPLEFDSFSGQLDRFIDG